MLSGFLGPPPQHKTPPLSGSGADVKQMEPAWRGSLREQDKEAVWACCSSAGSAVGVNHCSCGLGQFHFIYTDFCAHSMPGTGLGNARITAVPCRAHSLMQTGIKNQLPSSMVGLTFTTHTKDCWRGEKWPGGGDEWCKRLHWRQGLPLWPLACVLCVSHRLLALVSQWLGTLSSVISEGESLLVPRVICGHVKNNSKM